MKVGDPVPPALTIREVVRLLNAAKSERERSFLKWLFHPVLYAGRTDVLRRPVSTRRRSTF